MTACQERGRGTYRDEREDPGWLCPLPEYASSLGRATALLSSLRVTSPRTEHSVMGIASFVLSIVPAVLLTGLVPLVLLLESMQLPGADEVGCGAIMLLLVLMTVLSELVALALGIAGALQRKRTFAFLGIACSILVLVVGYVQDVILPVWM